MFSKLSTWLFYHCGMDYLNRTKLKELLASEQALYESGHPASKSLHETAHHLFGRVPMTWMNKWAGGFPLGFASARGATITDLDGNELIDFALGDTGAMAGHSPTPLIEAMKRRIEVEGGVTTMLPNEDAEWVAHELTRRFGLPQWSFSLSATDANRWLLRLARLVTQRPKILVFSYSYHGTVDETFVVLDQKGDSASRPGNVAPACDPTSTTRVVEFNDLAALERELSYGDVAAVLTEPALTNIGIVLPQGGFLEGVRALCDATGTLLILDETHTFSAGPGGATQRFGLRPDAITIGKSLGGGVPCGAYGLSRDLADRVMDAVAQGADVVDVGGVGGTLAGNPMSSAAMRAVLGDVLTDEAFGPMEALATEFTRGVQASIDRHSLPWSISQLGARCEYRFANPAPMNGGESMRCSDEILEDFLHLYCINRGVLLTPFHNMALMCPASTLAHVDRHSQLFEEALALLFR
jgi:glutamate-1-semialdehyde 2,1-aminomutase